MKATITSPSGRQIKNIQLLLEKPRYRRETSLFVAEGIKMFLEAPEDMIDTVYVSEEFSNKSIHMDRVARHQYEVVADHVFSKMSATQTPQGVLTVLKQPIYNVHELLYGKKRIYTSTPAGDERIKENALFLILNRVQDPGNLGTMIRTAEAAGAAGVLLDRECADIFNPKVIRSTMGSVYRVPFAVAEDMSSAIREMKEAGVHMVAAHLKGQEYYSEVDYSGAVGIMIGNEGNGLSEELSAMADTLVRIPMDGRVESLNAAISAALFMYEVKRRRI